MPAEELAFKVAYEGPLTEFTARNPTATVSLWCDWRREVVEVSGAPVEEVDALREVLSAKSSFVEHYAVGERTHVLVMDCINLPHDFVDELP